MLILFKINLDNYVLLIIAFFCGRREYLLGYHDSKHMLHPSKELG
jgi:hypothetical protein